MRKRKKKKKKEKTGQNQNGYEKLENICGKGFLEKKF